MKATDFVPYLNIMLSIPRAKDRCIGSTDLKVATTFGIAAINVNQIEIKIVTRNPGRNLHCLSQLPRVAILS